MAACKKQRSDAGEVHTGISMCEQLNTNKVFSNEYWRCRRPAQNWRNRKKKTSEERRKVAHYRLRSDAKALWDNKRSYKRATTTKSRKAHRMCSRRYGYCWLSVVCDGSIRLPSIRRRRASLFSLQLFCILCSLLLRCLHIVHYFIT